MKDWFFGLESRERLLVGAGGVLLLWLVFYLMIWEPVTSDYHHLREGVAAQKQTLVWMQQAAAKIRALRSHSTSGARGLAGRSMLAVVDQSARSGGLGSAIKRIEPDGSKGVKIWMEGVAFDPMIVWLGTLNRTYRIEPGLVTLEPVGGGRVNVRLSLVQPAA